MTTAANATKLIAPDTSIFDLISAIDSEPPGYFIYVKCKEAEFTLGWGCFEQSPDTMVIYSVNIREHLRRTGIFTRLLNVYGANPKCKSIGIYAVGTHELVQLLAKITIQGHKFCNRHGGDYLWYRDGICKSHHY